MLFVDNKVAARCGKSQWGEEGAPSVVGEGCFWKKGQNIPRTWKRREYKLREDAVLFYFDGGKLRGSLDVTEISLSPGSDKNHGKSGAANFGCVNPVSADLCSKGEGKVFELVFETKEATDTFCRQLMAVSISTANIEKFVRDFHWKEANRLLGEEDILLDSDEDTESRSATITSISG